MSILEQIETEWFDCAARAIVSQVRQFPNERFYAGGFWLFYVDYTMFGTPAFGMNTESMISGACGGESKEPTRWSPAEWQFSVLPEPVDAMKVHYDTLSRSLVGQSNATWDSAMEQHTQALARVCRRLTEAARSGSEPFNHCKLPPDFVVGIFEEQEGPLFFARWVRASIAPETLSKLRRPAILRTTGLTLVVLTVLLVVKLCIGGLAQLSLAWIASLGLFSIALVLLLDWPLRPI
jgi:hypothetical protein